MTPAAVIRRAAIRAFPVLLVVLASCQSVPDAETIAAEVEKEREVGEAAVAKLVGQYGLVQDQEATEFLNLYLQSLALYAQRQELLYRAAILDTAQVNAFALPGGYILVTLGTLQAIETPGALAGVIAHELGHVDERHILENVTISVEYSPAETLARLLAGGRQIINTSMAQVNDAIEERLFLEGYLSDDEYEADEYGVNLLQTLGISAVDYRDFLASLGEHGGEETENLDATHPPLSERVARIDSIIEPTLPRLEPTDAFRAFLDRVDQIEPTNRDLVPEEQS